MLFNNERRLVYFRLPMIVLPISQRVTVTTTVTSQILILTMLHFGILCLTDLSKSKETNRRHYYRAFDICFGCVVS